MELTGAPLWMTSGEFLTAHVVWHEVAGHGARFIDQRHRALRHPQAIDEVVALVAYHVDEGVADPDHVELGRCGMGVVHGRST